MNKHKSNTPFRPFHHPSPEEIIKFKESLIKLRNSSEGITERTILTESLSRQLVHERSVSLNEESLAILKSELQAKQDEISSLSSNQKELTQSIAKLKAQNNSLNKELNACRKKSYELDVELYLAREEVDRFKGEVESLQHILKNTKELKDENLSLREENSLLKSDFLRRKKNKSADENEKKREKSGERNKRANSNFAQEFKMKDLEIKTADISPERIANYTERNCREEKEILKKLQLIFNVQQKCDILSTAVKIMESLKSLKTYKKFFNRLAELVVECSPAGAFVSKPNIKQVWMWITRLLEEYMKLKKNTVL